MTENNGTGRPLASSWPASTPEDIARRAIETPGSMLSMLSIINGPYLSAARHREGLQVLIEGAYPHFSVLRSYFTVPHGKDGALHREFWAKPLRELIKLGPEVAPIDFGEYQTAGVFTFGDWSPNAELTHELAELYLKASYIRWDKPLPGQLPKPGRQNGDEGFLPLAAAIYHRHDRAVHFLLDGGASMNIGPVTAGGADQDALDFANRISSPEVAALLTAHAMRQRIATASSSQPALDDPHGSELSAGVPPRRRRLGV